MQALLRYPLVLRHVPRGMQLERYMPCSRNASVFIRDVAETDAPVVLDWMPEERGSGERKRFRLVDDVLMSQVSAGRTRTCRDDDSFPCAPLVGEARKFMTRIALEKGKDRIVPQKFIDTAEWSEITDGLPAGVNLSDERFWQGRFEALVEGLVAVDNGVWRRSAEPVVCVHRNAYGWHASLVTSREIGADLMRLHFPVDRWDEARETCRRLAGGRPVSASRLEHDPAYSPTTETDISDISDAVARVVAIMNAATSARGSGMRAHPFGTRRSGLDWSALPVALFECYAALRRFDEATAPADDSSASIAVDALQEIVDMCRGSLAWLLPQAASVQAHIDKWNARAVAISLDPVARPAPRQVK